MGTGEQFLVVVCAQEGLIWSPTPYCPVDLVN